MGNTSVEDITAALAAIPELPADRPLIYARLWQFETWLRHMVYVELRANYGDGWNNHVEGDPDYSRNSDQALPYMPTPEKMDLSYISFSSLIKTIAKEWDIFQQYFPPQPIWDAKIKEISQIRNRIAHFRRGHVDDYQRITQFLRDVDKGFFDFCTSLNQGVYPLSSDIHDPVIYASAPLNPYIEKDPNGNRDFTLSHYARSFEIKIGIVKRPWMDMPKDYRDVVGRPGFFYNVDFYLHNGQYFNIDSILKSTRSLHQHLLYFIFGRMNSDFRILLPSMLGEEKLIVIIRAFIDAAANDIWPKREEKQTDFSSETAESYINSIQAVANRWPEYVIGPQNPMSFLTPDMECSFFNA